MIIVKNIILYFTNIILQYIIFINKSENVDM